VPQRAITGESIRSRREPSQTGLEKTSRGTESIKKKGKKEYVRCEREMAERRDVPGPENGSIFRRVIGRKVENKMGAPKVKNVRGGERNDQ